MERNTEQGTKNLVKIIRDTRKAKRFTQEQMAAALGINRSSYGHVETGTHKLSVDMLCKACGVLGLEVKIVNPLN